MHPSFPTVLSLFAFFSSFFFLAIFFFFNPHPHFSQLPIFWRSAAAAPRGPLPIIRPAPLNCPLSDAQPRQRGVQPPLRLLTLPGANVAPLSSPGTSGPRSPGFLGERSLCAGRRSASRAASSCFPSTSCIRRDLSHRAGRRAALCGPRGQVAPRCPAASSERRS